MHVSRALLLELPRAATPLLRRYGQRPEQPSKGCSRPNAAVACRAVAYRLLQAHANGHGSGAWLKCQAPHPHNVVLLVLPILLRSTGVAAPSRLFRVGPRNCQCQFRVGSTAVFEDRLASSSMHLAGAPTSWIGAYIGMTAAGAVMTSRLADHCLS
jgi:hypothetical protein